MSLLTEDFSENSLISTRIILSSPPNTDFANIFAVKVLPTPVVPSNKKLPIGLSSSLTPDLDRKIERETFLTASGCPMTNLFRFFSKFKNILASSCFNSERGILTFWHITL